MSVTKSKCKEAWPAGQPGKPKRSGQSRKPWQHDQGRQDGQGRQDNQGRQTEQPRQSDKPWQPERPRRPEQGETAGESRRPEQGEVSGTAERTGQPGKPEMSGQPGKPGNPARSARYERNGILTEAEQALLSQKRVAVIGCGGLGGHVLEMLARLGIGHLIACDGDRLEPSNLNRQILSTEAALGMFKAEAARLRIAAVNSQVEVRIVCSYLDPKCGADILAGCDAVVDGLDSGRAKLMLQGLCREFGIPLIHGAIDGWFGQVTTVFPGDDTLRLLYGEETAIKPDETPLGNPSFTPAAVASLQVSETVKVLLGRGELLRKKVWFMDLYHNEFETVKMEK